VRSLEGTGRDDVLFELKQVVETYDFYQRQMEACDQELQRYLAVCRIAGGKSTALGVDAAPTKRLRRGAGAGGAEKQDAAEEPARLRPAGGTCTAPLGWT